MLTDPQIDKAAEITGESYAAVQTAAASINAAVEAAIVEDIATWDANRNAVDFEMSGGSDGIRLRAQTLLDAIRDRTRRRFGFSSLRINYGTGSVPTVGAF